MSVSDYIHDLGVRARAAAAELAKRTTAEKNAALEAIATALEEKAAEIKAANAVDVANAKKTFRTLIGELRKVAPKAVVGISTLIIGSDQNAFSAYGCSVSSVQCHKNIHAITRGYVELVAEMNAAGDKRIRLVPVGQAIDPYYGYLRAARTPFVHSKEKREVITNALHPSLEGGKQMGDAFAAWLLCELGKDGV